MEIFKEWVRNVAIKVMKLIRRKPASGRSGLWFQHRYGCNFWLDLLTFPGFAIPVGFTGNQVSLLLLINIYNLDNTTAASPRTAKPTALLDCWLKMVLV